MPALRFFAALILTSLLAASAVGAPPAQKGLSAEDRQKIDADLESLGAALGRLPQLPVPTAGSTTPDSAAGRNTADARIFHKGVVWALRYEQEFQPADLALITKALDRGRQRAAELAAGNASWAGRRGRLARGYVSAVDGSTQPYGLVVPASYDANRPIRLDVVLHGSTRPVGLSELRFINRFDEGDAAGSAPQDAAGKTGEQDFIELHPLGRVENCYRWAGETDVFEAIEDVCRKYAIDRNRIVLRGMSMGASGTWHLGLKHPDYFVALGPYCGYVDTHQFSLTPLPNFVKVGPLPPHQELGLHMLDSIDYAANAGVVPAIACMGEKDVFFQAHVLMGQALAKEGLQMVNLISPGTGHVIDPVTHKEQMRRIGEYTARGLNRLPTDLRFVTWTLKYSRCHWLQVLGLGEHYARAEISARISDKGKLQISEPRNVTMFAIDQELLPRISPKVRIGEAEISLGIKPETLSPSRRVPRLVFAKSNGKWEQVAEPSPLAPAPPAKRPGIQGPIDDAFTTPFLCVRGTGSAWNTDVQAYADASLRRFAHEWAKYFRGDLPVKDDTAVTTEDVARCNLILFGDPGSNLWIGKALPNLPIEWSREKLRVGSEDYAASSHVPALIHPSPFPGAVDRYVVVNSGHTFREKELALLNYLLFPRWGDWAVLKIGDKAPAQPAEALEEVLRAGYFDEAWKVK